MIKCRYGPEPATKKVIWADGRAFIPTCDKHVQNAKEEIEDEDYDQWVTVEPLKQDDQPTPEQDAAKAETWDEFKSLLIELKRTVITPGGRVGNDRRTGSSTNGRNWVEATSGELPPYIRIVRNGLMKNGHSESRATALAVAAVKRWARGGDNVSPKVQAAAAKAVAQWEAMKARAGKKNIPWQIEYKRSFSTEKLAKLGVAGMAFRNHNGEWSYPIENEGDLRNAIQAFGRASGEDKNRLRAYIVRRARALKKPDLIPDGWKSAQPTPLMMAGFRARTIDIKAKKKKKDKEREYTAQENLVRGENEIERESGRRDPNRVTRRGTDPSHGQDSGKGKGKARRIASQAGERRYHGKIGDLIGGTGDKDTTADRDARIEEAADLESKLSDMVPMKQGAKGVEVRYLQDMLEKGGYGKFELDGIYGPKTVAAVKKAQKDLGLEETGTLDNKLLKKLIKDNSLKGDKTSGGGRSTGQRVSDALSGDNSGSTDAPKVSKQRIARAEKEAEKDDNNVLSTEDPKDMEKLRGMLSQAGYDVPEGANINDPAFQSVLKRIQAAAGLPEDGVPNALLVQLIRNAIGEQKSIGSVYDLIGSDSEEEIDQKETPMQMEHKTVSVTGFKVLDSEEGLVETIVSVTGLKDNVNDIIEPGAYEKTLVARTPKGVWHHSWETPVSRTESVKELMPGDSELPKMLPNNQPWPKEAGGLKVTTRFNLETQRGREAYSDVLFFGDQQEWSIGYNVPTGGAVMDKSLGVRRIKTLDLYEYSPVLFGAMPAARTSTVKEAQFAYKSLQGVDVKSWMEELAELKKSAGQDAAMGLREEDEDTEAKNMGKHKRGSNDGGKGDEGYGVCKKCGGPLDPDGVCANCGPDESGDGEEEKGLFEDLDFKDVNLSAVSIDALRKLQTAIKTVLDQAMGEEPQDEDDTDKKELPEATEVKSLAEAVEMSFVDDELKDDLFLPADEFDAGMKSNEQAGVEAGAEDFLNHIDSAMDKDDLSEDEEKSLKWLLEVFNVLVKSTPDVESETVEGSEDSEQAPEVEQETTGSEDKAASGFVIDTKELDSMRALLA